MCKLTVKLKTPMWDTMGQEHYQEIAAAHYWGAVESLLVCDITYENARTA